MSLREKKKAATVAAIRQAAARLFAERGYDGTKTRDIAEAAGIATGTLFNYAPTKRDVVLLLWKERAQRAADEGLEQAARYDEPVEAILAVFRPIFAFYAEDLELGRVFLDAAVYGEGHDLLAFNTAFIGRIGVLLTPHVGVMAPVAATNAFAAYYLVLSMMLSRQLPDPTSAEHLLRTLLQQQQAGFR